MAEQLVFALAEPGPPTFANFVVGANAEVVAAAAGAARGPGGDSIHLWGPPGVGKTHLLLATLDAARAAGRAAHRVTAHAAPDARDGAAMAGVVAVDDVERADAALQGHLFTLFNAVRAAGGTFVAAGSRPPAQTAVRDDLRTRLGWGVALEVRALPDAAKPAALAEHARARGFALPDDVANWLLTHAPRDMSALVATLEALDRYSLARARPVTLPLVREWMLSTPSGRTPL